MQTSRLLDFSYKSCRLYVCEYSFKRLGVRAGNLDKENRCIVHEKKISRTTSYWRMTRESFADQLVRRDFLITEYEQCLWRGVRASAESFSLRQPRHEQAEEVPVLSTVAQDSRVPSPRLVINLHLRSKRPRCVYRSCWDLHRRATVG